MKKYLAPLALFWAIALGSPMIEQTYDLNISDHGYLTGFLRPLSGQEMLYHSMSPDITSALLVRANSGNMAIEWETEPVRFSDQSDQVKFIWVAGVGCNLGTHNFDLFVNDKQNFSFQSIDQENWEVKGEKGGKLSFQSVMIDMARDRFGLMALTLPKSMLAEGKPVRLKIVGRHEDSNAWIMTFKEALKEKISVTPTNSLLKNGNQSIKMNWVYFGEPVEAEVLINDSVIQKVQLDKVFNRLTLSVPAVVKPDQVNLQVRIKNREILNENFILNPIKKFTLNMVQHTHTDIGYTRPQTEILSEHLRYIDYALDYCDFTDDYPEEAKFRWTCEASWPVREYLENRPQEQIERLAKRVQEGRIEITGMMFNMSEVADEAVYVDFIKVIKDFKNYGMTVKTAMQNDVNGFPWALVDYFQHTGIEYLSMGTHGHKALIAFDHPTVFWLESPSGNRLLAFRADHYMTGNRLGIHGEDFNNFESHLFKYLEDLFEKGYPLDEIAVQYSGYTTDNSPPGLAGCEMIKKWNEKYEWPKLKSAIARNFLDNVQEKYADKLQVYRAAWPDWWTDGFGSAARETAAARETHAEMVANLGLLSIAKLSGANLPEEIFKKITAVQDALLFYDEHTYGAAESISDPDCINSRVQWMEKAAYVWEAVKNSRLLTEYGMGLIQPFLNKTSQPVIAVFNTLNWERSGVLEIFIDNELLPRDKDFSIVDDHGREMMVQRISGRPEGNLWAMWAENIPALGYKSFRIISKNNLRELLPKNSAADEGISNEFYSIKFDKNIGAVTSFYDKEIKQELCDNSGQWKFGQLIYELAGPRGQLDGFVYNEFSRNSWQDWVVMNGTDGPLWSSLVVQARSEGFDEAFPIELEIRLFHKVKRVEFHYTARKEAVLNPESVYIAFPFFMENSIMKYEVQGALVEPGKDQIPGSSSDWNTFQNFITIQSDDRQIVWGSDEMPLVHLGDINLGKFMVHAAYENPYIFSWPMNNIWVTNFRATQSGELNWSYYITSQKKKSESAAARFGWSSRVPFLSRVLPPGGEEKRLSAASFLNIEAENLLLISCRPSEDEKGILLQLRETEGKNAVVSTQELIRNKSVKRVQKVNVLEEKLEDLDQKIHFKPYEVMFVKIEF
ncbi:MAG: hypothetical protein JXQ65_06790 [Candidatus Marinimicrobia bacterium]|nr:hypothetical protein [Candidatus Neomarinimicrobiota bacterium]